MRLRIIILILVFMGASCVKGPIGNQTSSGRTRPGSSGGSNTNSTGVFNSTVSSVSVVNNQIILQGNNLNLVNSVQITGPSGFNETLSVETQSPAKLIANGLRNISFAVDGVFNLIISNAQGTATFQVSFALQDGTVTGAMLSSMGASVGQVLTFDGTKWVPNDLAGLTYAGNWNGALNSPDLTGGGSAGEYYIVSIAGTYDLSGGAGTDSWAAGDWVVWNSVLNQWEKIDNASGVVTFNGRNGAVVATTNDYTWAQIDKSSSMLADIADVDTTGVAVGKILKWDGAAWSIADDASGGGALPQANGTTDGYLSMGDWTTFNNKQTAITTGLGSQYLKGDLSLGTFGLDVRSTTLNGFSSTTGSLSTADTVLSAFNKLDGNVNSKEPSLALGLSNQYYRGDKTWQNLTSDAVTEGTNKYYTALRARTDLIETASITNGQITTAPSSDVVFDQLSLKENAITGSTDLTVNSLSSTAQGGILVAPFGTGAGQTGEFRFYELTANGSNYAGFKSPDTLAGNLMWTLPANDGTSGQVLSTNGSGVLSWITGGGGSGTSASTFDVTPSGTGAGQTGEMRYLELAANGVNYVTFKAPDSLALDMTWTLPGNNGSLGQVLSTDGTGTLSWIAPAGGAALPAGTGAQDGYIVAADWTTFNNKQNAITTGSTAQYLKGDLSLGTLAVDVRATALTGFSSGSGVVSATDSVLSAVNKLDGNIAAKEPALTAGTVTQYYRGDKTWQTLNSTAVTEGTNLYYTALRARGDIIETASLTNGQTSTAPSSDVVFDRLALKQNILSVSDDVSINSITTDSQAAINLSPYGSVAGQTGEFRFYELSANGSNYTGFKAPNSLVSSLVWTLPANDGSTGQILSTNGSGVLSWVTDSGGAGTTASTFDITPIGTGAGQTGEMRYQELAANGTNYVTFKAPDNLPASLSWTLPANNGSSGQVLSTDGVGALSWIAPSGGAALPAGSGSQDGYIIAADWTTFNSKQAAIDATTDLSLNSVSSDSQFGLILTPYGTGAGQTGGVKFNELASNGTNYAAFKGADSLVSNLVWTLPDADGSSGQVLSTDGSGILSWVTASGGGAGTSASTFDITPIGTGAGQTGEMRYQELAANGTNYVTFKAPDNLAASLIWTLPANNGSSGQVLSTDGVGALSWIAPAGGAALPAANGSQDGYITSADWNTFNSKQTLLTTGTAVNYYKGDQSLGVFATDVRATTLSGFVSGAGTVVAGDNILNAIAKLDGNIATKEPSLTAGTAAQYYRGDKTWQTLETTTVPEGTNLYYTTARAQGDVIEVAGITNGLTTRSPSSDVVFDQLATKQAVLGSASAVNVGSLTSALQNGVSLNPYGVSSGQTGEFRFYELSGNGINYIGFKSPDSLVANKIWTLPSSDGSSGQVLSTDGTGILSWIAPGGGGGGTSASTFTMTPIGIGVGETGELRFNELTANGTNFVTFKSPDSIPSDVAWTLPAADGASGEVLSTDGAGNLSWTAGGGGGGGGATAVALATKIADYTVVAGDEAKVLIVTGATTITLPPASSAGNGFTVTIKNNDASNVVKVAGDSSETIDGSNVVSLFEKYSTIEVASSGSEWFITFSKGSISPLNCPTGFVNVPGNSSLGTEEFCVMKYEARNNLGTGVPISHSNGAPSSNSDASVAFSECQEMQESGFKGTFAIIKNSEWMTIARNIESVSSNWSGGSVGSGFINRGWSAETTDDGFLNTSFASSSTPSCLYNTAANTCAATGVHKFKRTHTLSNGDEIWDLSGNAEEWVDWDEGAGFTKGPNDTTEGVGDTPREITDINGSLVASDVQSLGGYNATNGMGRWYGITDPTVGAATRGGNMGSGTNSGIYTLVLASDGTAAAETGFRCVYRP